MGQKNLIKITHLKRDFVQFEEILCKGNGSRFAHDRA